MLNLLIVDDEQDIADSLYMHFKQIEVMELDVYKAYSANEALEWLNRTKIDVVLSDIRMPGMNGLQLLDIIKVKWPKCKVIFLTGYNDFDYIYAATKNDGVKYLLKTEGYEVIVNEVQKAFNEFEFAIEMNDLLDKTKSQMLQALPLLQKEFLLDLLVGAPYSKEEIAQQLENLNIQLDASIPLLLLAGSIDKLNANKVSFERTQTYFKIKLIVEQLLHPHVRTYLIMYDHSTFLWIIQPNGDSMTSGSDDNGADMRVFVKGMLDNIQAACKEVVEMSLSLVIDNRAIGWETISERFVHLKQLLNFRIGTGLDGFLVDSGLMLNEFETFDQAGRDAQKLYFQLKKITELGGYLESGKQDQLLIGLSDVVDGFKDIENKNHNPSLELFYSMSIMFLSYINRWNLTEKIALKINMNKLTRADEHSSWKEAGYYFLQLANVIFDIQRKEEEKRSDVAVSHIKDYIIDHLGEDLSLVLLAEQVHFNPSYLSRLFKQVTGNNIFNFIKEARLAKSKELLRNNHLRINEIATAVGYISAPYFTRSFRKATNMSPQEYRDHSHSMNK
ncbi:response regulator transcription factor [Paenibacillus nasutitermitis]|uniref:DNA-binding response regulator n=1 Tax=Paenibacillus nasutitermitis TaxID=1652958 RepID=A0A916YM46_9BACL|nr:response regulator [Paenibacillus nasutitermitis]GGD51528.1 hypothetical protein GCM10010911_06360 [Paenibacillus nasutitermitis]